MNIRLLAFASAAEILGGKTHVVEIEEGASLADLKRHLCTEHPRLMSLWQRLAIAVDGDLVSQGNDPRLKDGVEVALLPPVSGGSPGDSAEDHAVLVDGPIDTPDVQQRVETPENGAVLVFLGAVRNHHQGRPVVQLTYDAYRPMAERRLRQITRELEASQDGLRAAIVHRLGEVPAGEPSVVIAVSSPHRQAAYEASREALERLKREVPIWKQEHYGDGEAVWREVEAIAP